MLIQSARASRCAITRAVQITARAPSRTYFTPTCAQSDLVRDLYMNELKKYKPTPIKASDAQGHVQKFALPKTPQSPEETDMAKELKAYEEQQVEVEGQASAGEATTTEEDWFEDEAEEEEAKH